MNGRKAKMFTLDKILAATQFSDLFPEGTKKELRQLLKTTHPDLHPNNKAKAEKAFVHVNILWTKKNEPNKAPKDSTHVPENTIITKKHEYLTTAPRRSTSGVNTYDATYESGTQKATLLIATHPQVGAALIEGIKNLKHIREEIPSNYLEFFPETRDAFYIQPNKGIKLSGVAQTPTKGFYTLAEVLEDYPAGISGKDVAWMYRRLLVALGNAHDAGISHGAPTREAFLIQPETHALILTNWQFSQELENNIHMVTAETKTYYEADKRTSAKKDLQIASEAVLGLLHGTSSKRIKSFLLGMSRYPTESARSALQEFDSLLKELWGERKFHEFKMRRTPIL